MGIHEYSYPQLPYKWKYLAIFSLFRPQRTKNLKVFRELPVHVFRRQENKIKSLQAENDDNFQQRSHYFNNWNCLKLRLALIGHLIN